MPKNIRRFAFFAFLISSSLNVRAGATYLNGKISNLTSTSNGIMIMLDSGVPDNCQGTPYGWMIIDKADTAMISVALLIWSSMPERTATVYTTGLINGYCRINQIDPTEPA